jgi:integrase
VTKGRPLASIIERTNAKGEVTSYQVKWRHKGRQESYRLDTRKEAETFARVLAECGNDGRRTERALLAGISDTPVLRAFAPVHIKRLSNVEGHTIRTYEAMLKNHIYPALGDLPVGEIDADDVAEFMGALRDKRLSPKTIKNIHSLLYSIMETGIEREHVKRNPCAGTRLPKKDHTADTMTYLTHAEFAHLMSHMDPFFRPLFYFLVGTGLRFSEAAALNGADISDEGGEYTVRVTKAWKRDDINGRYIGPPKSHKAIRTINMAPELAYMIAPLVRAAGHKGLVFGMKRGGALTWGAIHNKAWQPAIRKAQDDGFRKKPRIHDLRHTYASWQLATGDMSIFELSLHMGHENVLTTSSVYSHLMPEGRRKAARVNAVAMGPLFAGAPVREVEA